MLYEVTILTTQRGEVRSLRIEEDTRAAAIAKVMRRKSMREDPTITMVHAAPVGLDGSTPVERTLFRRRHPLPDDETTFDRDSRSAAVVRRAAGRGAGWQREVSPPAPGSRPRGLPPRRDLPLAVDSLGPIPRDMRDP